MTLLNLNEVSALNQEGRSGMRLTYTVLERFSLAILVDTYNICTIITGGTYYSITYLLFFGEI